jgi:hypothetical protein
MQMSDAQLWRVLRLKNLAESTTRYSSTESRLNGG